ncbi:hypothetical protein IWW39_002580 [Coemansia spiralis]|uniref:WD40 repeat-like protein n=1 Tax=Coemansia spiralis TaxID=417178 RepID=A0A9W8GMR0_9FUNG|nr:hypothetical protein IWW39_002580 [Coemansia spiralis]
MEDPTELLDSKAELDQEEMERLLRENRALKGRLDELERENRLLKQRNFDLSMRYGRSAENRRQPFELVFMDSDEDDDGAGNEDGGGSTSNGSDNNEVSGAGYSIEESESGRDINSGNESADGATPYGSKADLNAARPVAGASASAAAPAGAGAISEDRTQTSSTGNSAASLSDKNIPGKSKTRWSDGSRRRASKGATGLAAELKATREGGDLIAAQEAVASKAASAEIAAPRPAVSIQGAGLPSNAARIREKQRRVLEMSDADKEGSARYADVESAPAKEKRPVRDNEDRHGGGGAASRPSQRKEAKQLKCYAELDGHEGAIYSTQYSGSGGLVASASFDKTVRVWDIGEQKSVAVLEGHQQSVFDVAWRDDSMALASAAFDRTCIEWDIATKSATTRLQCEGLVQCVRYSTHNPRVLYAGDSSGFITIHDTRQAQSATKLSNDGAMVNTIYCFNDETRLVSGDCNGEIKMWDVRIGRFMRLVSADAQRRAISHISVVKNEKSGTEFMATNSYDNVLRVYDRVDDPSVPTPRVIHELRGIRSRNWPIKNAFLDPRVSQDQLLGLYDDDYFELDTRSQSEARGLSSMLFLITGSAEPFAYLYKLNTHAKTMRVDDKAKRGMRQRLEGHSDRVYAVATHPTEIKACTAGADGSIRLWHIPSTGRQLKEAY